MPGSLFIRFCTRLFLLRPLIGALEVRNRYRYGVVWNALRCCLYVVWDLFAKAEHRIIHGPGNRNILFGNSRTIKTNNETLSLVAKWPSLNLTHIFISSYQLSRIDVAHYLYEPFRPAASSISAHARGRNHSRKLITERLRERSLRLIPCVTLIVPAAHELSAFAFRAAAAHRDGALIGYAQL